MCLEVFRNSRKKTARKDIVVYKRLVRACTIQYVEKPEDYDGKECIATIDNEIVKGKINVYKNIWCEKGYAHHLYICSDNENFDGSNAWDKHGFIYSWVLDRYVTSLIVDGVETLNSLYKTPHMDFIVNMGKTYHSELIRNVGVGQLWSTKENKLVTVKRVNITVGLHSFATPPYKGMGDVIAKCIIPKGSKYYEGMFGDSVSLASDTLTYVEIIDNL